MSSLKFWIWKRPRTLCLKTRSPKYQETRKGKYFLECMVIWSRIYESSSSAGSCVGCEKNEIFDGWHIVVKNSRMAILCWSSKCSPLLNPCFNQPVSLIFSVCALHFLFMYAHTYIGTYMCVYYSVHMFLYIKLVIHVHIAHIVCTQQISQCIIGSTGNFFMQSDLSVV